MLRHPTSHALRAGLTLLGLSLLAVGLRARSASAVDPNAYGSFGDPYVRGSQSPPGMANVAGPPAAPLNAVRPGAWPGGNDSTPPAAANASGGVSSAPGTSINAAATAYDRSIGVNLPRGTGTYPSTPNNGSPLIPGSQLPPGSPVAYPAANANYPVSATPAGAYPTTSPGQPAASAGYPSQPGPAAGSALAYPVTPGTYPRTAETFPAYSSSANLPAAAPSYPNPTTPAPAVATNGRLVGGYLNTAPTSVAAEPQSPVTANLPLSPSKDPKMIPCEGSEILARVGTNVVLACDVLPEVDEDLAKIQTKLTPMEMENRRMEILSQKLMERVQTMMFLEEVKREVPAEGFKSFMSRAEDHYEQSEIEPLMKRYNANNREELDAKLRAVGKSIARERKIFAERLIAQQWMRQKVKIDDEVSLDDMLTYYHAHLTDFETQPQARWDELMVRQSRFATRHAAYAAIVEMGNEVMRGKPFADVAKAHSQGSTTGEGGRREWTSQGGLKSKELDAALFHLPLNELSQIIETEQGFHIIRVLERKPFVRTEFVDAQSKIREGIKKERTDKQMQEYFKKVQTRTPTELLLKNYAEARMTLLKQKEAEQNAATPGPAMR